MGGLMNKVLYLCLFLSVTGCSLFNFRLPSSKVENQEKKIEKTEQKAQDNLINQFNASKAYVFGANLSLAKDTNKSPNSVLAYDLTSRSLLISGPPSVKDANFFTSIVDKTLSTNAVDHKEAEKLLKQKDELVIKIQDEATKLLTQKDREIEKLKQIAEDSASKADIVVKAQRFWASIKWFVIGVIVLRVIVIFIPPPMNSIGFLIDYAVGAVFALVKTVLPEAAKTAKVVSKEAFDVSESTLKALVSSIQEARQDPALRDKLDAILKDKTDKTVIRPKIISVKQELGHI